MLVGQDLTYFTLKRTAGIKDKVGVESIDPQDAVDS